MNTRQTEILIMVRDSAEPLTVCEIAELFDVSLRTIQNDIKQISYELSKYGINLTRGENSCILIDKSTDFYDVINKITYEFDIYDSILSPEERVQFLFNILLFHQGYITITNLSVKLNVSRGTVLNDLNRLKKLLNDTQLILLSNARFGIKLSGDEKQIREFAVKYFIDNTNNQCIINEEQYHYMSLCNRYSKIRSFEESKFIYNEMLKIANELDNHFSESAFLFIISYIEISIERTKIGRTVSLTPLQLESIYGTKEFKIVHNMMNNLGHNLDINFPVDEIGYLTLIVFSGGLVNANSVNFEENYAEIQLIVCTLIDKVANYLDIDIAHDVALYNNLVYHIKPAIYRLKKNICQANPLIDEIKKNYKDIFDAVKNNVLFIENATGSKMSDDEIGYITIHFLSFIEKNPNDDFILPNVLIVCDSGIGTSNLLATRLDLLYEVNIVGAIALYELSDALDEHDVDFIISTLDLNTCHRGIPIIKVSPFINNKDIKVLDGFMHRKKQNIKIDEQNFIKEISQYCEIIDQSGFIDVLKKKFMLEFTNKTWKGNVLMLRDVIAQGMIEVDFDAKNWEEAVRESGRLLMIGGCIDQSYVESMVNTVKTIGTYIVISKGIALPHSRSGEGAHKVGISMLRLAKPVVFGHPENDPVDLIFGLSSVDNTSHLTALQDLATMLIDPLKVDYIRNEQDIDQLYAFLIKEKSCNDGK